MIKEIQNTEGWIIYKSLRILSILIAMFALMASYEIQSYWIGFLGVIPFVYVLFFSYTINALSRFHERTVKHLQDKCDFWKLEHEKSLGLHKKELYAGPTASWIPDPDNAPMGISGYVGKPISGREGYTQIDSDYERETDEKSA